MNGYKNGQASIVLRIKLLDSSSTTGAGLTGLTSASSGLIISTIADNEAAATAYTQAGSTIETIATLGTYAAPTATKCRFKEVDATNHKGVYEIQIADARFAVSNAKSLLVSISGATNLAQADYLVPLVSDDPYVAKPTNFASLAITAGGKVDVNAVGTGAIAAASFAAGAIDAAAIAADAIGASELAADAIAEIQSGLSTLTASGVRAAVGLASANLDTQLAAIDDYIDTEVAAIKAKTDNLPSDPADASDIAASFSTVNSTLSTIAAYIDTEVAAIKAKTDNLPAAPAATGDIPSESAIAAAILDLADAIESGLTLRQALRLIAASAAGKVSGAATVTNTFRSAVADDADRMVATVDADGNRTAITYDLA